MKAVREYKEMCEGTHGKYKHGAETCHPDKSAQDLTELVCSEKVEWLTTEDVAQALNVAPSTVRAWRNGDRGPAFYKFASRIRYKLKDVQLWVAKSQIDPEIKPLQKLSIYD